MMVGRSAVAFAVAALAAVGLALACDSNGDRGPSPDDAGDAAPAEGAPPRITSDGGGGEAGGPGGGTGAITCGAASCELPEEHCCTYNNDAPPPLYLFACAEGAGCPPIPNASDAVALGCASAANCPADTVCCLSNDNTATNVSRCVVESECKDDGDRRITAQMCDPNAMPTGCPPSAPCSTMNVTMWNLPPGYATCGGKGL
jgi:hypothetical protein